MKKNKFNIIVDVLAFFALVPTVFSGIVVRLALPAGRGMQVNRVLAESNFFWGLHRRDWLELHEYSSLVFLVLVAIHLALHIKWIRSIPGMIRE